MLDHIDRLMKAMRYAGDSIAHDLRSPLTRLRTRLDSAAAEIKDPTSSDVLYAAADDAGELLRTFDSVLRIARLEAGGSHILADRGLISQAVSNLVENAIKYTPKGGRITLSLKRGKSGRTQISVTDDGPGMAGYGGRDCRFT